MRLSAKDAPALSARRRSRAGDLGSAPRGRQVGFTLLEVLFSVTLTTVVVGGAISVMFRSQLFVAEESQRFNIDQTGRRVLLRLGEELRSAAPASVQPVVMSDSNYIVFQKPTGYDGSGALILGPVIRIDLETAGTETANHFLRLQEGTAAAIRVAGHVLGLRFTRLTNGVSFAVDVASKDCDGQLVQKTFDMSVSFRN